VTLLLAMGELVPDYNRDGKIDEEDWNKVTKDNPWRFWVNDDNDEGDMKGTDIPGQNKDQYKSKIPGVRDLVDWFPLYVDIKDILKVLPADEYEYCLSTEGMGNKVRYVETELEPEESKNYLEDVPTAQSLAGRSIKYPRTDIISVQASQLSAEFTDKVKNGTGGVVLVAGSGTGTYPLQLEVRKNEQTVLTIDLNLSISNVEEMFRHKNLSYGGGVENTVDDRDDAPNWPNELSNGKNFIFVHGYNVNQQQARGWAAEVFKKMWQSGLRSKFYAITWHGADSQKANTATIN
jgi:hypothetical protein